MSELNHSANVLADAVEFAEGSVYRSKFEFYAAQRSPRYRSDPHYRTNCDAKLERTLSQYPGGVEGVRTVNPSGDHLTAAAFKKADGTIGSVITSPDDPYLQKRKADAAAEEEKAGPRIESLVGGGLRVTIRG